MPRMAETRAADGVVRWRCIDQPELYYDHAERGFLVFDQRASWADVDMIGRLYAHGRRATYEARSRCSATNANLRWMVQPPCHSNSWIVEAFTGRPSAEAGYGPAAIDPRLLAQLARRPQLATDALLDSEALLRTWLATHFGMHPGAAYSTDGWVRLP